METIGDEIASNKIRIYNSSQQRINISLYVNDKVNKFLLGSQKTWLSPNYTSNPVIKIKTGSTKFVEYDLVLGNDYIIYWNEEKKV